MGIWNVDGNDWELEECGGRTADKKSQHLLFKGDKMEGKWCETD